MGIFTVPVQVNNTRIYVSPSERVEGVQLTLYKNDVRTMFEDGFMILPVPYARSVRFHHPPPHPMNSIPFLEFMNEVERAFDFREHRASYVPSTLPPRHQVAQYQTHVLYSKEELIDYNDTEHILHPSTIEEIVEIYSEPYWGFILCSIQAGEHVYEPLCYTHQMIGNELFVPSLVFQPRSMSDHHIPEETNRFDDKYFINGTVLPEYPNRNIHEVNPSLIHRIPWRVLPPRFQNSLVHFLSETRRGSDINRDLFYPVNPAILYGNDHHDRRRFDSDERVPPPWW